MNNRKNVHFYEKIIFKCLSLCFAMFFCTQFLFESIAANDEPKLTSVDRTAFLCDLTDNVIASAVTQRTFYQHLSNLEQRLKQFYPDEFHDNLDKLDDVKCENGGLTERQYAMSDFELVLEEVHRAEVPMQKIDFLGSLKNHIQEYEMQYSEKQKEQTDEMFEVARAAKLDSHEYKLALDNIVSLLEQR